MSAWGGEPYVTHLTYLPGAQVNDVGGSETCGQRCTMKGGNTVLIISTEQIMLSESGVRRDGDQQ